MEIDLRDGNVLKWLIVTMKEVTKKWIQAGKVLGEDADAKVNCPDCEKGILTVTDVVIGFAGKTDRILCCPCCSKENVITMGQA
ncbi:hypothetical protein SAMN05421788_103212 [Filimonas lacunae]|uniref:Uncharacterized protein n=2 Tax=Filimonas lacunae TaxID=477680 RepID=A0A1N7P5K2_9BACT|nr:hypothetical protein SAMN05421788_103212 [Filimonas lacunae]